MQNCRNSCLVDVKQEYTITFVESEEHRYTNYKKKGIGAGVEAAPGLASTPAPIPFFFPFLSKLHISVYVSKEGHKESIKNNTIKQ
ncbi:hypothetical protein KDH_53800 [Dictyobacter sp. S3.2.2.5]|uniref:Uncharacterized protein n=1 Tax=Dictyobacter halimunensis TaxID=3026934 RepID=A0ABQ6G0D3_9CHLR|nr:hypothetical protein KDH_53800 [Dictyobacter sp. S3.2.2.5]